MVRLELLIFLLGPSLSSLGTNFKSYPPPLFPKNEHNIEADYVSKGVLYEGAAGRIAPAAEAPKFTPGSHTWVASMTKLVTAVCAMQLVEKGLIGLDDDVRPLIPQLAKAKILKGFVGADIPYLEENTDPITLRSVHSQN